MFVYSFPRSIFKLPPAAIRFGFMNRFRRRFRCLLIYPTYLRKSDRKSAEATFNAAYRSSVSSVRLPPMTRWSAWYQGVDRDRRFGENSRRTTWRNERTEKVQERVTWMSHSVDSYTLPAPIWRHGRVSYQPGGPTPVKPTPVDKSLSAVGNTPNLLSEDDEYDDGSFRKAPLTVTASGL